MQFTGTTVLKVIDGKIVEEIGLDDGVAALTQLGLIKHPAAFFRVSDQRPLRGMRGVPSPEDAPLSTAHHEAARLWRTHSMSSRQLMSGFPSAEADQVTLGQLAHRSVHEMGVSARAGNRSVG